jgi:hypothetical protein
LIEENEYEGHCKCMQNPYGLIVLSSISNGRWNAMWFLMVEEICPLKYDHVKFSPKWLQTRSYKSALKSSKGEKQLQQEVIGRP